MKLYYLLALSLGLVSALTTSPSQPRILILGGTGRIGTAVAAHLLLREPHARVVLAGRDKQRGTAAVREVVAETAPEADVTYHKLDWRDDDALARAAKSADCLIHVAGPFLNEQPSPLQAAIDAGCAAYVDVADPLEYLDKACDLHGDAVGSQTSALLSAGAFPGLSNVLAVEASAKLPENEKVGDCRFNYFTAGLGGSGDINLFITNIGFGEDMVQYEQGKQVSFEALSGSLLGKVSFFLGDGDESEGGFGNSAAKARIGTQTVFSWPFPEAATVPRALGATGSSSAAMGTAPDAWNVMLGVLVSAVPRKWWRSPAFSKFLADFSQPLVKATDFLLRAGSPDAGETHAMRVDVTGEGGSAVSVVQAHESFRRCVGQSCAEFALDVLAHPTPGVYLPEQRYRSGVDRHRVLQQLTKTPGTLAFTGARRVLEAPPPTGLAEAIERSRDQQQEERL